MQFFLGFFVEYNFFVTVSSKVQSCIALPVWTEKLITWKIGVVALTLAQKA